MNWSDAYARLAAPIPSHARERARRQAEAGGAPARHPALTEGAKAWQADWSGLVRRRAASGARCSATDPRCGCRRPCAPHNYRGGCCVADSAIIYTRIG